jgi:hypothetical protein
MASAATLITWVRDAVGVDTAGYISDSMIMNWLNIGQRSLATAGGILYTSETAVTVAGQEQYSVPGDYLRVMAIYLYHTTGDKAQKALIPMTVIERDPTLAQGTPDFFYIHGANVSGDNSMVIGLSPIPDTNNAGCNLEIWIRQLPKDMVSGGQGPEAMLQWQDALIHFAAARAFTRLSTADPGKAALADREMAIWETWMKRARKFQSPMALGIPHQRLITYTPGHDSD